LNTDSFNLIEKGSLGTCWYGKYHYIEPWAGCAHDCAYCYARHRSVVAGKLSETGNAFENPALLFPLDALIKKIREGVRENNVKILKLSRYTDFFTPSFVKDGTSAAVLEALCETPVERIIITTKGAPDDNIFAVMKKYREKISYNAAVKPESAYKLEKGAPETITRIEAAERANRLGVKTTIHMDPLIPAFDGLESMPRFFAELKKRGLTRLMFSFLLLNEPIIASIQNALDKSAMEKLLEDFNLSAARKFLPKQDETVLYSINDGLKKAYSEKIGEMLCHEGFDFVICSLKSNRGEADTRPSNCPACDGTFYA